jgi:hypothetical protein
LPGISTQGAQGARKHLALERAALLDEVINVLTVAYAADVLLDDGTLVSGQTGGRLIDRIPTH